MSKGRAALVALVAVAMTALGLVPAPDIAHAATPVALTVGDVTSVEPDAGAATMRVPISLNQPSAAPVNIKFAVVPAGATRKRDYQAVKKGKVSFRPGDVEANVSISVIGDALVESNESVSVVVTQIAGAALTDGAGVVTMTDNDANGLPAWPEVTTGQPTVWEGNTGERSATVPIQLSAPSFAPVTVSFDNGCGVKTVVLSPGQVHKNVNVDYAANFSSNPTYAIPGTARLVAGFAVLANGANAVTVRDDDGGGSSQAVGSTVRASETTLGRGPQYPVWACTEHFGRSRFPSMSANGRYVAFESNAWNLVPNDTNNTDDIFVKDLWTGILERVSISNSGGQANDFSAGAQISADGRFVLFTSMANNLVPGDVNIWPDVFLYDRLTRTITNIAPLATDDPAAFHASISADNRYVAFDSHADLAGDTDEGEVCFGQPCDSGADVYVLDRTTGTYTSVTNGQNGAPPGGGFPTISANGASIAYISNSNVDPTLVFGEAYVTDWKVPATEMVTVNSAEQRMVGWGTPPVQMAMSADGRQIAFIAEACNLGVPCRIGPFPDYRSDMQVYVRDRNGGGFTSAESWAGSSPYAVISTVISVALSANGRYVTYGTNDPAAIPGWSFDCYKEVVQRDRLTGLRFRVSRSRFTGGCPRGGTDEFPAGLANSADGSFVAWESESSDVVTRDARPDPDVFVTRLR